MKVQVLLIGGTGHIGGAVLDQIHRQYPSSDVQVSVLVRKESDAEALRKQYDITPITGSLETIDSIVEEVKNAHVVINCGPDAPFAGPVSSILSILGSTGDEKYYLATSGAASIWSSPNGFPSDKIWDDIADVDAILALPDSTPHTIVDKLILGANTETLHTAIVSPVMVTGISAAVGHPTPLTWPDYTYLVEKLGSGYIIGPGENQTNFVHVNDLANLYLHLFSSALEKLNGSVPSTSSGTTGGDGELWGPRAYYFGAGSEKSWKDFMNEFFVPALRTHEASFLTAPEEIKSITIEEATELVMERLGGFEGAEVWSRHIAESMGVAMRVKGSRAEKAFNWKAGGDIGVDESLKVFLENRKGSE